MQQNRLREISILLGAVVCVWALGACGTSGTTPTGTGNADVWATVDSREIRKDEVEKAYRGAVDPTAPPPTDDEMMAAKLSVLDELITQDILLARAKTMAVEPTEAEVEKALAERKQGVPDAEFQLQLSTRGLTMDDVKRGVRRDLTLQKVFEKEVTSKIGVSEPDIAAFYAKNRQQFNVTEPQVRLAQIIIAPGRNPQLANRLNDDAVTPAEVDAKLKMLTEKLKAGGEFANLAADYSEDPQVATNGGDLGLMPVSALDRVPPQLKATVMKMEPGSANVVSVGGSYAIVMLVERAQPGQRELTTPAVHDGIRDMLKAQKERLLRAAYVSAARADAKVVNNLARQVLAAPVAPPAPAAPAAPNASPSK